MQHASGLACSIQPQRAVQPYQAWALPNSTAHCEFWGPYMYNDTLLNLVHGHLLNLVEVPRCAQHFRDSGGSAGSLSCHRREASCRRRAPAARAHSVRRRFTPVDSSSAGQSARGTPAVVTPVGAPVGAPVGHAGSAALSVGCGPSVVPWLLVKVARPRKPSLGHAGSAALSGVARSASASALNLKSPARPFLFHTKSHE
jgi:hypothetical protein